MSFKKHLLELASRKAFSYVQIGGNDGVMSDPIWPFLQESSERVAKADVFEPNPVYFERLCKNLEKHRQIRCHNLAIGTSDCGPKQKLYYLHPEDIAKHNLPAWTAGICSFYLDKNALGGIGPQQTPEMHQLIKPHIREINVSTMPLAQAFERVEIMYCDVLLTDTEGHDWQIVKQWDFFKFGKPLIIHSEVVCLTEQEKQDFFSWLNQNGYEFRVQGQNVIAKLKN